VLNCPRAETTPDSALPKSRRHAVSITDPQIVITSERRRRFRSIDVGRGRAGRRAVIDQRHRRRRSTTGVPPKSSIEVQPHTAEGFRLVAGSTRFRCRRVVGEERRSAAATCLDRSRRELLKSIAERALIASNDSSAAVRIAE